MIIEKIQYPERGAPEKHPMLNSSTAQKEKSAQLIQDNGRKPQEEE